MKAIILVLSPEKCEKLLNGDLSILVRKKFPKDYVGWVYIYCTKEDNLMKLSNFHNDKFVSGKEYDITNFVYLNSGYDGKGKVVARFWCDKVELIEHSHSHFYFSEEESKKMLYEGLIERLGCINADNLHLYLKGKNGYAIHINDLEIFDKPKEISEFSIKKCKTCIANDGGCYLKNECQGLPLTRAPRSWCYVEELK